MDTQAQHGNGDFSDEEPELTRWSDNIRILETLGREGRFPEAVAADLIAAYIALRSASHRLALQQADGVVPLEDDVPMHRDAVLAQWSALFAGVEPAALDGKL